MAVKININGHTEQLEDIDLASLQEAVGGYIEAIYQGAGMKTGEVMLVNEEGLLMSLPSNPTATTIAGQYVVGNAVLLAPGEFV